MKRSDKPAVYRYPEDETHLKVGLSPRQAEVAKGSMGPLL